MDYFCNMNRMTIPTVMKRRWLYLGVLLCAWSCAEQAYAQSIDRYGNAADPYDRRVDRQDPFDRNRAYGGDSLNAFGERILSYEEQLRQDSIDRASNRSVRDRKVYSNRYKDSIQVYKIIDIYGDTTFVDTTLNIGKYYKMNPTRRDEYGYMPFPNLAEGYTPLMYVENPSLTPDYAAPSRSMYYRTADQVKYYDVRTPWSEAMYHSNVFSNMTGQVLDFNFTANVGKQVNFSFGFRGKRTFGLYNYIESHHGQLVATFSYHTKSYRYIVRSHAMYQYLSDVENGGLTHDGLGYFLSDDKQFSYRKTLPVNLSGSDAEVANRLGGTRFFLSQSYDLFGSSIKNPTAFRVSLLNEIQYEHRTYKYYDPAFTNPSGATGRKSLDYYGSPLLQDAARTDSSLFNTLDLAAGAGVNFPLVNIYAQGMIRYQSANYTFPGPLASGSEIPLSEQSGNTVMVNLLGRWRPMRYFGADARLDYGLSGMFSGARILNISGYVQLNPKNRLEGSYRNASYYAPLTARFYRSSYAGFNWYNDFNRIESNEIAVTLRSDKLFDARVSFTDVSNYVYYDSLRMPRQYAGKVNVLAVTLSRDIRFRWFGWDNTLTYQNVSSGSEVLPLPEVIVRSSVYAYFPLFRKAITLMPAVTLRYFSAFDAPMYNPLLSDYNLQPASVRRSIGDYPYLDLSLSAKVRRTRLFLKLENFTPLLTKSKEYFSSPYYPSVDPVVRFGVVWDWFN